MYCFSWSIIGLDHRPIGTIPNLLVLSAILTQLQQNNIIPRIPFTKDVSLPKTHSTTSDDLRMAQQVEISQSQPRLEKKEPLGTLQAQQRVSKTARAASALKVS
jgi:hypothetical protein